MGQTVNRAENVLLKVAGTKIPVIESVAKIVHNGRELLVENYVDISAQKKIEERLQVNQKRLELMNEKLKVVGSIAGHGIRN